MKKNLFSVYIMVMLFLSSITFSIFFENTRGLFIPNDLKSSQDLCYYTLTINIDGNGSVVPPGGDYYINTVVNLTAIPDGGWNFSHWSGDLSGNNNPDSILMDSDKVVNAHFNQQFYTLNFTYSGSGSGVAFAIPVGPYLYGELVFIEAVADYGSHFVEWSGDHSGNENPDSLIIVGNITVDARFDLDEMYTLTVNYEGNGSVILNPPGGEYYPGTIVNLKAIPDFGYAFIQWSGDIEGNENPKNITMNSDKTVTAQFIKKDTEPPSIKIIKPKKNLLYVFNIPRRIIFFKNTEIVGFIVIKAEATDDQGIDRVEFYIDNELKSKDTDKPYKYTWVPKLNERGEIHTIKVIAYDKSNNTDTETIEVKAGRLIRFFHNHPQLSRLGTLLLLSNSLGSGLSGAESIIPYESNSPIAYIDAPLTGIVGIEVKFNGSRSYDPNGDTISFEWFFGDGITETEISPIHIYDLPGEYNITLTVTDDKGNFDTVSTKIIVYASETEKQVEEGNVKKNNERNFIWYSMAAIAGTVTLLGAGFVLIKKRYI